MKYTKIYSDEKGESHFKDIKIELDLVDYAPPAPPFMVSKFMQAHQYGFTLFKSGWYGDWHPAPRRQLIFALSGATEVKVSSGESRVFESGCVILVEDTVGVGHVSRAVSRERVYMAVVPLEKE